MVNAIEFSGFGETLPADRAPSDAQRRWLTGHAAQLDNFLRAATEAEIAREIGLLLDSLATPGGDDVSRSVVARAYELVLAGEPLWGIERACAAYRSGNIGDRKWAPKPPELCQTVRRIVRIQQEEREIIRCILRAKILPAPTTTPERRREIAEQAMRMIRENAPPDMYAPPVKARGCPLNEAERMEGQVVLGARAPAPIGPEFADDLRRLMGMEPLP